MSDIISLPTVKVSDLPDAVLVTRTDSFVIDQPDATRKASLALMMSQLGVMKLVNLVTGGVLESNKDIAFFPSDGKYYVWAGLYPKVIPPNSTPASTGGISTTAWKVFGSSGGSSDAIVNLGNVTSTATINPSLAGSFLLKLTAGQCVLTITNPSPSPSTSQSMIISLEQGTGANIVAWPSNIKWSYGREPVLSYKPGAKDIFQLITFDNGTYWIGSLIAAGVE